MFRRGGSDDQTGISTVLNAVTSGPNGNFTALVETGAVPFDGYLVAEYGYTSGSDVVYDRNTYVYPGEKLAGTFVVFNVPDGATDVAGSYGGMTFPAHTVQVHKQNGLAIPSLTETTVRPGP